MKVITLCGSMRYSNEMQHLASELALNKGLCVLQCVYELPSTLTNEEKAILSEEHLKRIELSDAIYVVNIDGYIGESTKKEIDYAIAHNKEIIYHEFDLLRELKAYTPFDDLEKSHVENTIKFLESNQNCFARSNLAGHITAGGLVCDKNGNILLNHHKKSGMWFQFGGHCDGEANSIKVATREIMEEAGLTNLTLASKIIFDVSIQAIPESTKKQEPAHFHYDVNFLFLTQNTDFTISNESMEIKWVTIGEALKLISPEDDGMHRMVEKYKSFVENNNS